MYLAVVFDINQILSRARFSVIHWEISLGSSLLSNIIDISMRENVTMSREKERETST